MVMPRLRSTRMTSAAILAGGRARRLGGRDKSQLRIGGRSILERQVTALGSCTDRIFLVGSRTAGPAADSLIVVADRMPERGPLGGLDAALDAAGDDAVMLLACDMPNVTGPWLSHLVSLLDDVDAVVPRTERG